MRYILILLAALWAMPAAASDAPHAAASADAERIIKLDPIVLPTLRNGRADRQVTLVILLEMADGKPRSIATDAMPRLRDAYITELSSLLDYDWPGGAVLDLEFARRRLMLQNERVLGQHVVDRVLFDTIRERRV